MKACIRFLIFILGLFSFASLSQSEMELKVIYGEDNREEFYEVEDVEIKEKALSVVALVQRSYLYKRSNYFYSFLRKKYGLKNNLCKTERFFDQSSLAFCSGALVTDQHILTAAHCARYCGSTAVVFGYKMRFEGERIRRLKASHVYFCENVEYESFHFYTDMALLKLDRPVPSSIAEKLGYQRHRENLNPSDPIYMIGHPKGLPVKVTSKASVRSSTDYSFIANLDAYGGNSGSPVFHEETGLIEGVLVSGEQDYIEHPDSKKMCRVSHVCQDDECSGEKVDYIPKEVSDVIDHINGTPVN